MENNEKPKVDPGWNDPPMLNYSSTNPPPKSRITNKRVAFPLSPTSSSQSCSPSTNIPPTNLVAQNDINKSEYYQNTIDNIKILKDNIGNNTDIVEKLDLIIKMWNESRFSEQLQKNISELTTYLVNKDKNKATEMQLKLQMESMLVNGWMPAIRFILNNM